MKARRNDKLTLGDYWSLWKMSLHSFIWRVDGRQAVNRYNHNSSFQAWLWIIVMSLSYLVPLLFVFGIPYTLITGLLNALKALPDSPARASMALKDMGSIIFGFMWAFVLAVALCTNWHRLACNFRYTKSAWWRNTGIHPSQVREDKGLYGEYISTMAVETFLKKSGFRGKIFNNVIVPKRDGDFNEIDIVCVCEAGIIAFEAKARSGAFYGEYLGETWRQEIGSQAHEMHNPMIQNQGHVNYLMEHLYEHLPDSAKHVKEFLNIFMFNIVLFNVQDTRLDINGVLPFNCGMYWSEGKYAIYGDECIKDFAKKLDKNEIKEVCALIRPLARHTQAELEEMKRQRQIREERGDFSHPVIYYIARAQDASHYFTPDDVICRDNGVYRTYLGTEVGEDLFRAMPAYELLGRSEATRDLEELNAYYVRLLEETRDKDF